MSNKERRTIPEADELHALENLTNRLYINLGQDLPSMKKHRAILQELQVWCHDTGRTRRLKREKRRVSEVPGVFRILTAVIAIALVVQFEIFFVKILVDGTVRLEENRDIVLGAEIYLYFVLGAVALYSLVDTMRNRGGG